MTANGYPGNPSLPGEVKERVLTTFDQTLTLFDEAQLDEVVAGCDLILEMDERFEPAKKLRQKAKDPAAPVDMAALYALRDSRHQAPAESGGDADSDVLQAVEELNRGNYEAAVDICNRVLSSNPNHEDAQKIGQQANERLEAGPFIKQFLQEADDAIDAGNPDAARNLIEKAKSLDPLHPDIAAITSRLESASAASAPADAGGSGFDFGSDSSPFASAFGAAPETPAAEPEPAAEAGGFNFGTAEETPAEPESDFVAPAEDEPASTDLGDTGSDEAPDFVASAEEPAATDFAAPAEPPAADFAFAAEAAEEEPAGGTADFGFTLEAEASEEPTVTPEPSSETPAEEPVMGEAQTFDFSTGDVEVTDDDQAKIAGYLADGDALFEGGDYQGAIDAWSKIFLIDVTNEQASERIETAKEKKREGDEKLEQLLTTGVAAYDRGDYTTARETFEEVIAQDPDNFRAQEYLEKLADHSAATGEAAIPPPPPETSEASFEPEGDVYQGDVYEEPAAAPPPPAAAPSKPKPAKRASATKKSSKGMLIAAVAVIVLGVGGYFGWTMLTGGDDSGADTAVTQGKITRAEVLAGEGDYTQAISILSSVEAGDPMRDQALQLIAQYKQRQAQTGGTVGGRPANQVRDELLVRAREAFTAEDYVGAKSAFEEAAKIKALDQADREMYDAASRQVSKLDTANALFAQGSYADAIEELSGILRDEPDNVNARQMLVDAHYNLGVQSLRNRNMDEAIKQFEFVLQQAPDDAMAKRSLEIATRYRGQSKDLMYEIFVKYLPLRS